MITATGGTGGIGQGSGANGGAGGVGRIRAEYCTSISGGIADPPASVAQISCDSDGDGVADSVDNCPTIANPGQQNNVHPGTTIGDHCEDPEPDGVVDFFDGCPDDSDNDLDGDGVCVGPTFRSPKVAGNDNCPTTANPGQANLDGDAMGDACDTDDDNDLVNDTDEGPCGSDPMDITPPLSRPERTDGAFSGVDDDGDTQIDEALPGGAEAFDCDGDGYAGTAEAHVFSDTNVRDQDPCGTAAWPSDFVAGGIPDSTNRVNVLDIVSFIAPVRRLNTSPPEAEYADRWDLVPGAGLFPKVINVTDLTALIAGTSGNPPMLGGVRAFNGSACPWAP